MSPLIAGGKAPAELLPGGVPGAELGLRRADVRVEGGVITEVAKRLGRQAFEDVLDARGSVIVPGLHDHHVHLRAAAAAVLSVPVGPPEVTDRAGLVAALRGARADGSGGWIRAVGYHESVAGLLERADLDAAVTDRPVRVQHRGGALWVLNTAALRRVGLLGDPTSLEPAGVERLADGTPTGRIWRADRWLEERLRVTEETGDHDRARAAMRGWARRAARWGVTGLTDATHDRHDVDLRALAEDADAVVPQRLHLMVSPHLSATAVDEVGRLPRTTVGPQKRMLDDTDLPTLDDLAAEIARAHEEGRRFAVHAVTAVQLALALAAFGAAGAAPGDRIEHGAVIPPGALEEVAAAGLLVVTQPGFVHARGDDYLRDVDAGEQADLWRAGSLVAAGVPVAAGTDAPFGPANPWVAVRAAVDRRTRGGSRLGEAERVPALTALRWWWGHPDAPTRLRRLEAGQPADLALLPADALTGERVDVEADVTLVAGVLAHHGR